ncbi:ATP-binding protein [Acidithiobacillus ferrivorans]|uniref:ATP-binding protein n=1 Tax=Acidithiobacillus ferrivorans TaxID=160808 RepID=A0A7T4WC66_9PROT|nr:ATP-binding protein [Acidithiobacillus ferrivorans]QQD71922.1 ATP-binding protein [Acidithiobacillus ferrivorans]
MSISRKPKQPSQAPHHKGRPQRINDLQQALLQRWGFDPANVAILPDRHPQFRDCEQHGRYLISLVDDSDVVRYMVPVCPVCAAEHASRRLLESAAIPARYQSCDFASFIVETPAQQAVLETCRDYAEHFAEYAAEGTCMVFSGNPGTGKNHLATAIARTVMGMGRSVLHATAHGIITRIRQTWGKGSRDLVETDVLRGFAQADLLIIDEVGKQFGGDGEQVHLFEVIDLRYRDMKPTIVLSNETAQGIENYLGVAAFDRLCQSGLLLQFNWPGHRRGRDK